MNEVAVGASFPRAAIEIVKLRLGHTAASEMILGASFYGAPDAVRLGLASGLVPADELPSRVLANARRLAGYPREAYAHSKAALIGEAVDAIRSETAEEALATMTVWIAAESRAARRRQREKLRTSVDQS